ncbi:hypothetical protein HK097_006248 [Rhizophlyctis rosea]|uniref:Rho-GAP domain-containing protein n=1 Tax=Rhizophlyctis rosea TaxID=64517 RepID=A0AAD5SEB6_9FUNG|nr:hypothetical protein HK097_006248 [Rhizophlyctis rosea]
MASLGAAHKRVSEMIAELVHPLQRFLDDNRKMSATKKDQIETTKKKLEKQRAEVEVAKASYFGKYDSAEAEERNSTVHPDVGKEETVQGLGGIISVGPRSFTTDEYHDLLRRLQQDVRSQDVKSILGTYKACVTPNDVITTLTNMLNLSSESAQEMFTSLTTSQTLRPISRTSKFTSSTTPQYYQWKLPPIPSFPPEPQHISLRRDATKAEIAYLSSIKSAETTRLNLEGLCIDYFNNLQHVETVKVALFKESMSGLNEAMRSVVETGRVVCEQAGVWVEMVDPKKEVEYFVERARTGNRRVGAVVREERGGEKVGIFGVELEELAERDHRPVPKLVRKALRALRESSQADSGHVDNQEIDLWIDTNMAYAQIHTLRQQLSDKHITARFLRRKATSQILVGLIKSFLNELPISVCGAEVYEEVKMVYLSKTEDLVDMRLKSLKSLLATLSPGHYLTLRALAGHWHRIVQNLDKNDKKLNDLAALLGPYVLRPKVESRLTLHDKHPARLVKDLLLHFDTLFASEPSSSSADSSANIPTYSDSDSGPETESGDEVELDADALVDDLETASVASGKSRMSLQLQLPSFSSFSSGRDSTTAIGGSSTASAGSSGVSTPTAGGSKRGSLQLTGFSIPGLIPSSSSSSLASSSGGLDAGMGSGMVTPPMIGGSGTVGTPTSSKRVSLQIDTSALYERSANLLSGVGGMFRKGDGVGAAAGKEDGKKEEGKVKSGRGSFSDVPVEGRGVGSGELSRDGPLSAVSPVAEAADLKDAFIEDLQSLSEAGPGKGLGVGLDPLDYAEFDSDDELDVDVRADGVVVSRGAGGGGRESTPVAADLREWRGGDGVGIFPTTPGGGKDREKEKKIVADLMVFNTVDDDLEDIEVFTK